MTVTKRDRDRLDKVEKRLARLQHNTAPTVPIYDLQNTAPPLSGIITNINITVYAFGGSNTDEVSLSIYDDDSGVPAGQIGSSSIVDPQDFTFGSMISFPFSGMPALTLGNIYWCVMERTGPSNSFEYWEAKSADLTTLFTPIYNQALTRYSAPTTWLGGGPYLGSGTYVYWVYEIDYTNGILFSTSSSSGLSIDFGGTFGIQNADKIAIPFTA